MAEGFPPSRPRDSIMRPFDGAITDQRSLHPKLDSDAVRAELVTPVAESRSTQGFLMYNPSLVVSPGRKWCFVTRELEPPDPHPHCRIDMWSIPELHFKGEIRIEDRIPDDADPAKAYTYNRIRVVRWFCDDHLLVGLQSGVLACYRVTGERVWNIAVGDRVEALAVSDDLLAVSVREPTDGSRARYPHANGVKLFRVAGDIERCDLRLVGHLMRESFPYRPTMLLFGAGGRVLYGTGGRIRGMVTDHYVVRVAIDPERLTETPGNPDAGLPAGVLSVTELCRQLMPKSAHGVELATRPDGSVIAATSDWCRTLDPTQPVFLPEATTAPEHPKSLEVSADGDWIAATYWSELYLSHRGGALEPVNPGFPVSLVWGSGFIGDRELVVELLRPKNGSDWEYELARFDLDRFRLIRSGRPQQMPEAHAVDGAGRFCIGTSRGIVNRFDSNLDVVDTSTVGEPIAMLAAEPFSTRLIAVTSGERFLWLNGNGEPPVPHGLEDGMVSGFRGSYNRAIFTPRGLLHTTVYNNRHAFIDGDSAVLVLQSLPHAKKIARFDLLGPDPNAGFRSLLRANWSLPILCCGIASIGDNVLILSTDGRLLRFEHRRCPLGIGRQKGESPHPPVPVGPDTLDEIVRVPAGAIGLKQLGPSELAAWTPKDLTVIELDPGTLAEQRRRTIPLADIIGVQRDPRSGGLIAAHPTHLSFLTPDPDEHLRMMLLSDDTVLWQAPPPPELSSDPEHPHPGYFWRKEGMDGAFLSAFRVLDRSGNEVTSEAAKRAFLERYFDRLMVQRAANDWPGYREVLALSSDRIASPARRLLSAWQGSNPRGIPDGPVFLDARLEG